ncbi:MAG TPA: acetylxylan esterase, partial [Fimbriimonas sp.]|nr:acetylxylan esterase [Fimbriimonas sp.]
MPLVDMPLAELEKYQGRNPKPANFDDFWNDSVSEMLALPDQIELTPSSFQAPFAECFELRFTGVGGSRIFAKVARPKGAKNCPALLKFHGYSANSGDWASLLSYAARGYVVAALDCRGQGGKSEDKTGYGGTTLRGHIVRGLDGDPKDMYFRNVFLDTAQLAKIVAGFD